MRELLIGYARVTDDRTAQRDALLALGVGADRVYLDTGMAGASRDRPGLREAFAACRGGDTLVVTALSRLARSVPDARDLVTGLAGRQVKVNLGGTVYDPADPSGRLLCDVLGLVVNFESDLARARVRAGMAKARAAGRLRGKQPKLNRRQEAHVVDQYRAGEHSTAELAELFNVARSTIYRAWSGTEYAAWRPLKIVPTPDRWSALVAIPASAGTARTAAAVIRPRSGRAVAQMPGPRAQWRRAGALRPNDRPGRPAVRPLARRTAGGAQPAVAASPAGCTPSAGRRGRAVRRKARQSRSNTPRRVLAVGLCGQHGAQRRPATETDRPARAPPCRTTRTGTRSPRSAACWTRPGRLSPGPSAARRPAPTHPQVTDQLRLAGSWGLCRRGGW